MPILVLSLFLFSCKSKAQSHKGGERTEKRGHNEGREGEGKEGTGHDKDRENHGKEIKGHDYDKKETKMIKGAHERDYEKGEGEEGGTEFKKTDTYNVTKKGVQLVLKYNNATNSFIGFMQNKTSKSIERARVEIHLSNGTELGPTKPMTLQPNQKQEIVIKATEKGFTTWFTHAEAGSNEHAHTKEVGKEHEGKERNEHK